MKRNKRRHGLPPLNKETLLRLAGAVDSSTDPDTKNLRCTGSGSYCPGGNTGHQPTSGTVGISYFNCSQGPFNCNPAD